MAYRVQVYTGSSYDEALKKKNEFEQQFESSAVDIVFDPPNYKLRVGAFATKREAEQYRDTLKASGMMEAWVVRAPTKRRVK